MAQNSSDLPKLFRCRNQKWSKNRAPAVTCIFFGILPHLGCTTRGFLGTYFFQDSRGIGREGPSRWQDRLLGLLPVSVKRGEVCSVPVFDHQKPRKIVIFQHPTWRFNEFQPQNMVSMAYSKFVLVAHSEWLKLRFKMLNLAGQTCPCGDVVSPGRPWWFWALSVERFGTKFEDSDSVSNEHEEKEIEHSYFKKKKSVISGIPHFRNRAWLFQGCWESWRSLLDTIPFFLDVKNRTFTNPC